MEDNKIVQLYWDRNEQAIDETQKKYGAYCISIASNILPDASDAEECVNDTWLNAWNSMPPHRPSLLSAFLGKITRNLAFDRYRKNTRVKRGGSAFDLVLDELAEIVSGGDTPEDLLEGKELNEEIDRFLHGLPEDKRYMFILRYWYAESISGIAERFKLSENNVSVTLNRIRKQLKRSLSERGYTI